MTRCKVCGLKTVIDAEILNTYQPDYAGIIVSAGFKRSISFQTAKEIRNVLNKDIPLVGVFVNADIEHILSFVNQNIIQIIQLHGDEDETYIQTLKSKCDLPIWKVFQMQNKPDLTAIENSVADMVLLDAGSGSGKTFDWSITNQIKRPFILAGGLSADNVKQAIQQTTPYATDVSSGVETNNQKDAHKIKEYISAVRRT